MKNKLTVESNKIFETIKHFKEVKKFTMLIDILGIDYPEKKHRIEILYLLLNIEDNKRVVIATHSDCKQNIQSITSIFTSSIWAEREVYDMYGVKFEESPDNRRILTDYNFEHFPLRKDFPLSGYYEVSYSLDQEKVVQQPVKLTQEYRNFDTSSPWKGTKYLEEVSAASKK